MELVVLVRRKTIDHQPNATECSTATAYTVESEAE